MEYSELLAVNRRLRDSLPSDAAQLAVLSNITIDPIREFLEYALRSRGVNADVHIGVFDNIVQESARCEKHTVVVVFWEMMTILAGLQSRGETLDDLSMPQLLAQTSAQISLVLENLSRTPLVLFNLFSALPYTYEGIKDARLDRLCRCLNDGLRATARSNVVLVDLDKIFAQVSIPCALDWRLYYTAQSLYSNAFYTAYTAHVLPALLPVFGKAKKALIFDCDNTLWKGIVGEDGAQGITISPQSPQGKVFRDVQMLALEMAGQGVIIGLCSKNNPEDVEAVLESHPDMLLRNRDIAIKRINWRDKHANLRSIAEDLNIGLDAILFVDDSPHEILAIQQQCPEIECFTVPKNLFQYPSALRAFLRCFGTGSLTREDATRTEMYQVEARRKAAAPQHASMEDFIRSLGLKVTLYVNPAQHVARIAQLTQKTNQFNLTTARHVEEEIARAVQSEDTLVVAADVQDRFGHYGLTGVAMASLDQPTKTASIDVLLLSCRVLGRQVEASLLEGLIRLLQAAGIRRILAYYRKTARNSQVEDFYDSFGFTILRQEGGDKDYVLETEGYHSSRAECIGVEYA